MILFHEPCFLLRNSHIAVVKFYCIVGLAKWTHFTMAVQIVALLDIGEHFIVVGRFAFAYKFVVTTFSITTEEAISKWG